MRAILLACLLCLTGLAAAAQDLQSLLQENAEEIGDPSRRTIAEALAPVVDSGLPQVTEFLERYAARELWQRPEDGLFFYAEESDDGLTLIDIDTGEPVGSSTSREMNNIRVNAGVRGVINSALVQFQLSDPDAARRNAALDAIARSPEPEHLEPLLGSIEEEPSPAIRTRKERLAAILTARFGENTEARIAAIESFAGDTTLDVRGALSQILTTSDEVAETLPEGENIARERDLTREEAYAVLVAEGLAPPRVSDADIARALEANIADGMVGGLPVATLGDPDERIRAYEALAETGTVPPFVAEEEVDAALDAHVFYAAYDEPDEEVTDAARAALAAIEFRVAAYQFIDIALDALSLASIYFLAAIGLAITFGVMGVINMAHGEFIMMGAYTGYVVQQIVPDYTLSLVIALPLAFAVTFGAGVLMERLVIRWLYHRPLETLLATFGISIALQQIAKNIFGTQARPLTSPAWLGGEFSINDIIAISNIRIAIFVLAAVFLVLILLLLNRTRIGLEVRAVTQNPGMAASMGINPGRINMLTFGLGSGIAGIAGVAIGLYAQVTSEMGANYIVQSFMTVVVGGVGNVWGTLAGAGLIGILQKGIEWFNPSNTLAAQTYMILFIILFIQFRPKGIVALKGRAAGD
ncbi:urea ABC transporter permease subunit UrtB [Pseudoroseicyclus sp. CXY001]|uniref:urea ABC transporter permease subunit UrtB n=1 Tax=Pseudoroseicyclus sp. CXY001 TaxID=3242492 RepID=UPI003570B818